MPYLRDWIAHPRFDDHWKPSSLRGRHKDITSPSYTACGWYDLYAKSVFNHVNAVRKSSRSKEARKHQRLLVGPWPHGINRDRKVGDVDFGEGSSIKPDEIQTKWFDHWLKDDKSDVETWPPFRMFVMGRNQWRAEQEWPLRRTRYVPHYFHSGGSADSLKGDGSLSTTKPGREPADKFVYDPDDPVPTAGGCNLGGPAGPVVCIPASNCQPRRKTSLQPLAATLPLQSAGSLSVTPNGMRTAKSVFGMSGCFAGGAA